MITLSYSQKQQLIRSIEWWIDEIVSLCPAGIREQLTRHRNCVLLSLNPEGDLKASLFNGKEISALGILAPDQEGHSQFQKLLETQEIDLLPLTFELDKKHGLRIRAELPLAAEENLDQVIGFEIDRLTPFKVDQVYFGIHSVERLPASKELVVHFVVVPKNRLNPLLDELAASNWRPQYVVLQGDQPLGPYNLLPEIYRTPENRIPKIANLSLSALCIGVLIGCFALPLFHAEGAADRMDKEIKSLNKDAKEVETLKEEIETLQHQSRFLEDRKNNEPVILETLEELSRLIPDGAWLNGLQYRDKHIVIQGQAVTASSLIEQIETSDFFKNTSFISPITKDTSNGTERFQIASDVINGRLSQKDH